MKLEILTIFFGILIIASQCESAAQKDEPKDEMACTQSLEIGPCRAQYPRFWYNSTSGACESFKYGGCQGNENNFKTLERCEKLCKK